MNNGYQEKFNEYIESINNFMYIFEITKCCGYSTFITIYKDETLIDLYKKIVLHFGGIEIDGLYYIANVKADIEENSSILKEIHIKVPLSTKPIFQFVRENVICKPQKLVPVYPLPNPIVYRLYLDDGHCHIHNNI